MQKPLASIILLTYNQESLVEESINSALSQNYSPLEIIIADDASTDKTPEKIKAIIAGYEGEHKIKLIFNEKNLGLCGNFNKAVGNCSGELIFGIAGDDVSLPTRCSIVINKWLELKKKPGLIATDAFDMSLEGEILGIKKTSLLQTYKNINDWIERPPYFFGSSHSWSRDFLRKFPPLNPKMLAEDHLMVFRAIISDGAYTISEPLVKHRRGGVTLKKYIPLEEKIIKLKVGFEDKYIYLKELLSDSKTEKCFAALNNHLKNDLEECQLAIALFNTESSLTKIKLCLKDDKIPVMFKLRMLAYSTFPKILKPVFFLKKLVRRY